MAACVSCQKEYTPRLANARVFVCPECAKGGAITVACAYCGETYVMPFSTYKTTINSGRVVAHAACARANRMSDPAHAAKISAVRSEQAKKTWASEGHRERQSEAHKSAWTAEMKARQSEIVAGRFSDEEERRTQSERVKNYFSDSANRQALSAKMKEICSSQGWHDARYGERHSCWEDAAYLGAQSANVARVIAAAGDSAGLGDVWGDDAYRDAWKAWRGENTARSARDATSSVISKIAVGANGERLRATERDWQSAAEFVVSVCGGCTCVELAEFTGYHYSTVYEAVTRYGLENVTVGNSRLQSEVLAFIRTVYGGAIETNKQYDFVRSIDGNKQQLDIYIPEFNLAFEVNGVYWHSGERTPDKGYHFDKSKQCRQAGKRLIHVWSYVWENPRSRAVLESIIKHALGQSVPVNARSLTVTYKKSAEMREFFDTNNVMGFRGGEFAVCLEDKNGEVWMAYIVGKGAHMSKGYAYEIVRGASKIGYNVRGGASKLMSAFIRDKKPAQFVYYVDYNYFAADSLTRDERFKLVAENVGFKNYWVKEGVVKNRNPGRHREIKQLVASGEVLELYDAGTATYLYTAPQNS